MRTALPLIALLLASTAPLPATAQALRAPEAVAAPAVLRPVEPVRALPRDVTRPVTAMPALSLQQRCLQTAERAVQPVADQRIAGAQRALTAVDTQRAAAGADALALDDPAGFGARHQAQQRAMARERDAAAQRLSVARANCR